MPASIPIAIPIAIPTGTVVIVRGFADVYLFAWLMVIFSIIVIFRFIHLNRRPVGVTTIIAIFAITGYVHLTIPVILNKIDRSATSVILVAMLIPFINMPRRNAKIDRRIPGLDPSYNYRLLVD
jgi:hypothetical protein